MADHACSGTETLYRQMLGNIRTGEWSVGAEIPSERDLIEQFGVSRIAIREALSMLRGLGVLDISHGRRTRVRQVDADTLGQLLPLMLEVDGQRTFAEVFEVRLAIESHSAALAARRRSDAQLEGLRTVVARFREQTAAGDPKSMDSDLEFHLQIARATANPLFPKLLEALAGFVSFAQRESCRDAPLRGEHAAMAHQAIFEAIETSDPERARVEMEAHLRFSMTRRAKSSQSNNGKRLATSLNRLRRMKT